MATKNCKQCGEIKPMEQFRRYYGGRKGVYKTCKLCEKINSREKYLAVKSAGSVLTEEEETELEKIHKLWTAQTQIGLQPPKSSAGRNAPPSLDLDSMLDKYAAMAPQVSMVNVNAVPQPELIKWLTETLSEEPEYYQDEVYEMLKKKYRPMLRIDKETMLPVYDDTYKITLADIAARFDAYEDTYYAETR